MDVVSLLRRVSEGDQSAWDQIVDEFVGLVYSVARSYRLGALTDDVVQTVWMRLAEHADRIREPARLGAWLATTTRNEALRVAKAQQRTPAYAELPERDDQTRSTIEELVADDDLRGHVLEAFARLSEAEQRLLRLLCAVPPLDYATIAEMVDRPIGSIGPTRERCLKKLRALLRPHLPDSSERPSRKDSSS